MFSLRKILFGGPAADLAPDVQQAVDAWKATPGVPLGEVHFHTRYVVVDIVASNHDPESGELQGIVAVGLTRGGIIDPADTLAIDFAGDNENPATMNTEAGPRGDRKLAAFLRFVGKSPLVVYHVPYVAEFLKKACKDVLGVDFEPPCVDLAWLLPSMFEEMAHSLQPLDYWLDAFEMGGEGRRDAMANALILARLFQRLLVRAALREVDTAGRLIDESQASSFLRRTH